LRHKKRDNCIGEESMRKLFLALFAVALLLFGAGFPLLFPRPSPVTKAAFDQLEVGMTRAEVEAILGGPPGDYTTGPTNPNLTAIGTIDPEVEELWWCGDEGEINLGFDVRGVVFSKEWYDQEGERPGVIERLRWRIDRFWARVFDTGP
jgi:hypothetical protein